MEKKESHWRAVEILLLQQVMQNIGKSGKPDAALKTMLQLMSELLGLNRGRIVLPENNGKTLAIHHAYGLTAAQKTRGRYRHNEGVTGTVFTHHHPLIVQDVRQDGLFLGRAVAQSELPPEKVSFIALPLMAEHRCIGVLACHRLRLSERTMHDDMAMLQILSTLTAQLLHWHAANEARTETLLDQNTMLQKALTASSRRYGIIGSSRPLLKAINDLEQVSASNANVLLLGESGTGKEMFARALHTASPRVNKPFIKVNCAAIPESLFESELFGHEKGAFTDARHERAGLFEQADGGTIFLDEIGELPLAVQSKLLRTLQEGTVTRLGSRKETKINVRVVTATHRNLGEEVRLGHFREDLYYRLYVIPIQLPPLRERREDIPELIVYFLNRLNQENQRSVNLTPAAVKALQQYQWPGNIRQLENLLERLVLLSPTPIADETTVLPLLQQVQADPLFASGAGHSHEHLTLQPFNVRPYMQAASHTLAELEQALRQCRGNKTQAAQTLGLTVRQFNYRLEKLKKGE